MGRAAPFFTLRAKAFAAEARHRRATNAAENESRLDVFVVTGADPGQYTWQIRQFGTTVVQDSIETFGSVDAARIAGQTALEALHPASSVSYH